MSQSVNSQRRLRKRRRRSQSVSERTEVGNQNSVEYRQTKSLMVSSVRYAAQHDVGMDFCASRYAKGPELERGNSQSGAPAIAKNVGDRSGEQKMPLNEYEKAVAYLEVEAEIERGNERGNSPTISPAKKVGDDMWTQEYLQRCQAGLSADLQIVQSSTASAGEMSQEAKDLIQSLKLAAKLTQEDLKKVQDINIKPAFDPDTSAGLGHNLSFFNSLATTRSGICLSLLFHFF